MRRYPAFDPPEYVDWEPDLDLVEGYRARLVRDPDRAALVARLTRGELLDIYRDLLRTRLHDIGLKRWVRTGIISKAWLGTGEEAVTVGAVSALEREHDVVCPMIRNAGALHMMGMPLADLFRGYLATADSPNGGRDLHVGDLSRGALQPISHMGINVPVLAGIALAFRLRRENRIALTWIGDGATRTAAFHEGLHFAAAQKLPVVYVLQNNQVALGTRLEAHGTGDLAHWAEAYGIESWRADGNNVLDVFSATHLAAARCRSGRGPALVVADTFRMGGHATHDEREARDTFPAELFREWGRRDPIGLYEVYLETRGVGRDQMAETEARVTEEMERAAAAALDSRQHSPSPEHAIFNDFSESDVLATLANRLLGHK
jgi:TPP-dependent pyruvate/acetoin dehydrogenase alpha subunit